MSTKVKSHREPRRKRASAWSWTARRIGVLIVTAAGIVVASWLAPDSGRPAPRSAAAPAQLAQPALPPPPSELLAVEIQADLAGPPLARRARPVPRQTGVPLNAGGADQPAGYEILSAAELDGISQARD
jgi:hypothetical protein